jgi:hypothetical protein
MATEIQNAYINALLADASYVRLVDNSGDLLPEATLKTNLTARLTEVQAQYILDNFDIVTQNLSADGGFDAVIWRVKAGSDVATSGLANAGDVYVSMRGTAGAMDIAQDLSLATVGIPYDEIKDMVNWWLKNSAPAGTLVPQIDVILLPNGSRTFVSADEVAATGLLANVNAIAGVNGHSLGGYLATAFANLFGVNWSIDEVVTFNSAGFSNLAAANIFLEFQHIGSLIGDRLSELHGFYALYGFDNVANKQTNYYAENGISVTTNSWADDFFLMPGFNQYGQRIAINQEKSVDPTANHSMYKLTDVLALGAAANDTFYHLLPQPMKLRAAA